MDIASAVTLLGGASDRRTLVARFGRREVDGALRNGTLVRVARGRYAVATASDAVKVAAAYGGVLSMRSAAQRHGWGQRLAPRLPDVTFPRTARVPSDARAVLVPHWSDLADADVDGVATSVRRTLVDCMRNLALNESLPIVDSAVRAGDVTLAELRQIADSMRGRGRTRARAVAALASSRAANPFESTLRAIAVTVPGLEVVPQGEVRISPTRVLHPDLYDERLGIVIEAESFEWHGESARLTRDCHRYNAFAALGLIVLRFSWSQVIHTPEYVFAVLSEVVSRVRGHANVT